MSISSGPLLSKPPSERTFVIAVTLLSIVAVIQVAAVLVAVIPEIRLDKVAPAPAPSSAAVAEPAKPEPAPTPTDEAMRQADQKLAEATMLRTQGKLDESLAALNEANRLYPKEPGIEATIGLTLRALGREPEAVKYLQDAVANPEFASNPIYAQLRTQVQAALAELDGGAPPQNPAAPSPSAAQPGQPAPAASDTQAGSRMRDEVGIPVGSVVGIVDVRLRDGEPGAKKLRVDTKASVKEPVDPKELRTMVYFFEQNDRGDIMQTQSSVMSEWLSPPVDWKNGDPELLEVTYPLPKDNRGDLPPLQYYGYMVGVYYKGELQDFRAEPVSLADEFPLKYSLTSGGE